MPRWGPLLLLSVTLRHAHRWCCCCSVCWPSSHPLAPSPFPQPSPAWLLFHQRLLYCSLPQINFVALFFRSAIFPSPCSSSLAFSVSLPLLLSVCRVSVGHPYLKSTLFLLPFFFFISSTGGVLQMTLLMKSGCGWEWVRREPGRGELKSPCRGLGQESDKALWGKWMEVRK